jgi:hypothetical protein
MRGIPLRHPFVVTLLGCVLVGCDSLTGNKDKSITLAVDDVAVAVAQGQRDTVEITVTRANFDQPVTLSVEGTLPQGVTASFTPNPLQGAVTTSKLVFLAAPSASPGTATVTIRATGEGVAEKGQTLDVTVSVTGNYTLGLLSPTITVAQGGGGDATVLLARSGGNASNVSLAVSGAPAGITVTAPAATSGRGTTLVIAATSGVAPGTYPVTITSSAAGISPDLTTQLSVVVVAPSSTTTLSVPFCSGALPVWFAFQNEGFPWQRVTTTGTAFAFAATERVGVAYTRQFGNEFETVVFYATRAELAGLSDRDCGGPRTLTGTVAGLTAGQTAQVVMGVSSTTTASTNFTLEDVAARPLDLIATRGTIASQRYLTPDKMIVRRALDLTTTIPALDFTSAESFAPVTTSLTVSGFTNGFAIEFQNSLLTATSSYGVVQSGQAPGGAATLSSVPAEQLAPGDLHELYVDAVQSNFLAGHSAVSYYTTPGNRAETLGPLLNVPSVTVPVATPYARARAELPSQAEYGTVVQVGFVQGNSGSQRVVVLTATADHYGARPSTWDLIVPDFSAVPGFTSSWMPVTGQSLPFFAQAFSGRGDLLFGAIPAAGEMIRLAYRVSTSSTLLRAPGTAAPATRPGRRISQYLSR